MDGSVVTTIANELGIAVDNAEQFIQNVLPSYATMEITEMAFIDFAFILPVIVMFTIYIVTYKKCIKREKNKFEDNDYDVRDFCEEHPGICALTIVAIAMSLLVIPVFTMDGIGWIISPEAKFLDIILSNI